MSRALKVRRWIIDSFKRIQKLLHVEVVDAVARRANGGHQGLMHEPTWGSACLRSDGVVIHLLLPSVRLLVWAIPLPNAPGLQRRDCGESGGFLARSGDVLADG